MDFCRDDGTSIFYRLGLTALNTSPLTARTVLLSPTDQQNAGGLIPMIPYFAMKNVTHALFISIGITVVILLAFGFVKNYITIKTKRSGFYGAVQTLAIGIFAAGTSYGIVRALDSRESPNTSI